jgi:hypothetical protein
MSTRLSDIRHFCLYSLAIKNRQSKFEISGGSIAQLVEPFLQLFLKKTLPHQVLVHFQLHFKKACPPGSGESRKLVFHGSVYAIGPLFSQLDSISWVAGPEGRRTQRGNVLRLIQIRLMPPSLEEMS